MAISPALLSGVTHVHKITKVPVFLFGDSVASPKRQTSSIILKVAAL
jgi:hypothetical protein